MVIRVRNKDIRNESTSDSIAGVNKFFILHSSPPLLRLISFLTTSFAFFLQPFTPFGVTPTGVNLIYSLML